jgi:hypothetical protein
VDALGAVCLGGGHVELGVGRQHVLYGRVHVPAVSGGSEEKRQHLLLTGRWKPGHG